MFASIAIIYFLTLNKVAHALRTDYYYASTAKVGNHFQNVCNDKCLIRGSYLASIPSSRYNDLIMDECSSIGTYCWIGLVIINGTFSWIDGTQIDASLIYQSLCNDRPDIDVNLEYMSYINSKEECWEITSNMSLQNWGMCG